MAITRNVPSENRDPISGATGAHPVGTGVGAAVGGAAAGAAVGTVAGPVGTAVGAAVGAVIGGVFGKGVAEGIDPTIEDTYWRSNYSSRPYVTQGKPYEHYQAAYRYGWESRARMANHSWEDSELALKRDWDTHPASKTLPWEVASGPVRDAWNRPTLEPANTQSAGGRR